MQFFFSQWLNTFENDNRLVNSYKYADIEHKIRFDNYIFKFLRLFLCSSSWMGNINQQLHEWELYKESKSQRIFLISLKIIHAHIHYGSVSSCNDFARKFPKERCGCSLSYFSRFHHDGKSCVIRVSLARKNLDLAHLDVRRIIRAGASRRRGKLPIRLEVKRIRRENYEQLVRFLNYAAQPR